MKVPGILKIGRTVIAVLLVFMTIWGFMAWKDYYTSLFPDIIEARPYSYVIRHRMSGVLLWREELIRSPAAGNVIFQNPGIVTRVAKKEELARIESNGGRTFSVKSPAPGYFVPGTDGMEKNWTYSFLWSGANKMPEVDVITWTKNNSSVNGDTVIGKIIPFPQELRYVGYVDNREDLADSLKEGTIKIQRSIQDMPLEADVRAIKTYGPKIKVYLTLPFFPLDIVYDRNRDYFVFAGVRSGVILPESCVILRDGRYGVFVIRGDHAIYTEVEGLPEKDDSFFVEKGLEPGSLVVLNGSEAREGRINLW